ncbi:MAG: thiamine biosynthesis protein ThiS [Gomphosphaeria aponina SAG 52.96 = DSM 107014]|uniref:Thiamine biosynthesis protein ThiS n=1 Tax=Gomphosphaeria aponina SAG 52.96 = DSM 107014 TaxID=1521640 RepID=A0A941JT67_9CHRO|nr:thiamine biosynthesis protein ThiS [Gomphosphaeria aponina SAG 52.96 = DSM 107014]
MSKITLKVNGKIHDCEGETLLLKLLTQLEFNPRLIAVEYNGEILQRQNWEKTTLKEGDRIEVVTIVGGG